MTLRNIPVKRFITIQKTCGKIAIGLVGEVPHPVKLIPVRKRPQ